MNAPEDESGVLAKASPVREDHRVRVARAKRERMKNHLLQSVLIVCSGTDPSGPAVIDDVIRHAKVARGTFYKYFESLDKAVTELGARLADEMTLGIYPVYNNLENPVQRMATGFLLFLAHAAIDPAWGAFVSHIGLLTSDSLLFSHITADIELGLGTGDFEVASVAAARDLLLGLMTEATRRIIRGGDQQGYAKIVTGMLLRSMGVPPAEADAQVDCAFERLRAEAPQSIGWWKPMRTISSDGPASNR